MTSPGCGQDIQVLDQNGAHRARYVTLCGGRALKVTSELLPVGVTNGMILSGWRSIAEDILTYISARPATHERRWPWIVRGVGPNGLFYQVQLGHVLNMAQLAGLLGAEADEMRLALADYALVDEE